MTRWSRWGSRATWACRCSTAMRMYSATWRCSTSGPCQPSLGGCSSSGSSPPAPPSSLSGCGSRSGSWRASNATETFTKRRPTPTYRSAETGGLISVNRRATQLLGYSAEELEGSPVLELFAESPPGRARAEQAIRTCLAGEEVSGLELEMRRRDGRPLWISLWMRSMRGTDGQISAAHSIWVDITDRVLAEAERARLQQQNLYLQEEIKSVHNFDEIIGRSPALLAVLDKVGRVAPTDATVLINGETGTGKELIARAIHSTSRRAGKPLIKFNCAALPTGLVESELFGHEKGAFTGAIARRIGRFELADGGTTLPRRDRRSARGGAGQAAPRPPGTRVRAGRRPYADQGRRPRHRRHQPRPAQGRPREDVPRRPLLSPERLPHPAPAASRADRGHSAAGAVLPRQILRLGSANASTGSAERRCSG